MSHECTINPINYIGFHNLDGLDSPDRLDGLDSGVGDFTIVGVHHVFIYPCHLSLCEYVFMFLCWPSSLYSSLSALN